MPMHTPSLAAAVAEAESMKDRGWQPPPAAALADAERALSLVAAGGWRAPQVQVSPEGEVLLAWESGPRGWLQWSVKGDGRLTHSAVIEGDEYGQDEAF